LLQLGSLLKKRLDKFSVLWKPLEERSLGATEGIIGEGGFNGKLNFDLEQFLQQSGTLRFFDFEEKVFDGRGIPSSQGGFEFIAKGVDLL